MVSVRKKLVIIGDGATGKTSLLLSYLSNDKKFTGHVNPTILETFTLKIKINENLVEFIVWDTAGQEEYERLRPLTYKDADIIIVCYSIDNPDSFENIIEKWQPELRYFCPSTPIILVGNKKDLRNDIDTNRKLRRIHKHPISTEEGERMSKRIKSEVFFECSSMTSDNVSNIFEQAAIIVIMNTKLRAHMNKYSKKRSSGSKKKCCIL